MRTTAIVVAFLVFGILLAPLQNSLLAAPTAPHLRPLVRGEWAGPTNSEAFAVQVLGNNAYVALGNGGMAVLDVSDPGRPVRLGGCDTPGFAAGIAVAGNHAYVADWDQGLQLIDVSNPSNCVLVGGFATGGYAGDVVVAGNYAYVGNWELGLQVIHVSDPAHGALVGGYRLSRPSGVVARTYALTKSGDFVYMANMGAGLDIIDVSNPTNCVWVRNYYVGAWVQDVAVAGNFLYVGDDHGLKVFDISNPRNSVLVGGNGLGPISHLAIAENHVYAKNAGRFQVLNVSNPTNCVIAGTYGVSLIYHFRNLTTSGNRIYIANGARGLLALGSLPDLRFVGEVQGGSLSVPFVIEAATSLQEPIQWTTVLVTNPPALPFDFVDYDVKLSDKPRKFYRARQ